MIKNKLFIAAVLLMVNITAFNQVTKQDNRTLDTKIVDLLAQMPATDQTYLNSLMTSLADFGEDGLVKVAGMLLPTGKGNDASVRFAVGGLSKFVMGSGQEEKRLLCQNAWCRALELAKDAEIKSFLIAQIQMVGNNQAIPCLEKYLTDEQLSDPAARALATFNTPEAGLALVNALDKAKGTTLISVVEALGNIAYPGALDKITQLASAQDAELKKVSLFALANIGSAQSATLLYDAALKSGFTFEPTLATSSYISWINALSEKGNTPLAIKQCINIIKTCVSDNQVQTRSAALSMLVRFSGEKATPYLYSALKESNRQYWIAALNLSKNLKGEKQTLAWIKKADKSAGRQKADIITMLGERGDKAALPFLTRSLNDADETVKLAAFTAVAALGRESSLPALLTSLKQASPLGVSTIKSQLMTFKSDELLPAVARALPEMSADGKIALIEVLASRKNATYLDPVLNEVKSQDAKVRLAALTSLSDLVSEKDLDQLYGLLSSSRSEDETAAVQAAVIAAVNGLPEEKQAGVVITKLNSTAASERKLYYGILAGIGNEQALSAVLKDFKEGNADQKNTAFVAMTKWSNRNAISRLCNIGMDPQNASFREPALNAILGMIAKSDYPDDQRLLLLRKAMAMAANNNEKSRIITQAGRCRTYLALKFAASYLDDPALQQDAANAVSSIALANKDLFGEDVKELLNKTLGILKGSESEYQKEAIRKHIATMPAEPGFVPLFNGKDLTGWKGLVENPIVRSKMKPADLAKAQVKADQIMREEWKVEDGILVFTGKAYYNLCTEKQYGDFEMIVDWKITEEGDAGIYLRGSPQVQIWDTSRRDAGAQVGSGGLYNNKVNERNPLKVADNAIGDWNTFRIIMIGERVTVYLNGELVVNNVILENYWDRSIPIFPFEQIELQAHGTLVGYRDIYVREIPRPEPYKVSEQEKAEGYVELFDGISMFNFTGNTTDYVVEDGCIAVYPKYGGKGNLYTKEEYGDFSFRFEFQLTPGANNGIGIRTPLDGDAAYVGMEIQVLDNTAEIYRNLQEYQYHGSVYGVIPARREFLKPLGEWNQEEIIAKGNLIKVILNGTVIVEGDIAEASKNGTLDHKEHPGLKNAKGHIAFLGHGSDVKFRNLRVKDLSNDPEKK